MTKESIEADEDGIKVQVVDSDEEEEKEMHERELKHAGGYAKRKEVVNPFIRKTMPTFSGEEDEIKKGILKWKQRVESKYFHPETHLRKEHASGP